MEIAVFGTGYIYQKYKGRLQNKVCCLVDNAADKQGREIDGIKVIAPSELKKYTVSYVVIMTLSYRAIETQLTEMGIPKEKVLRYTQIDSIADTYPKIHTMDRTESLETWIRTNAKKQKFLLISHDFSYTGVPVALMNLALVLKRMNYAVVMTGLDEGSLKKELSEYRIDYLEGIGLCYETDWFGNMAAQFDWIVAGTLILNDIVERCGSSSVRLLWWIHESDRMFYEKVEFPLLGANTRVFGGGSRAVSAFEKYFKQIPIQKLNYCIPDTTVQWEDERVNSDKVIFSVIGVISYRKAQDLIIKAISVLPRQYRNQFECLVVGKPIQDDNFYYGELENEMKGMAEVRLLGELSQGELDRLFEKIDVLLCPSRDDPMPIVVTQAMMHRKVCIISENVGQMEYIEHGVNGFVCRNEDINAIADYMMWAMRNRDSLKRIGANARKIYEKEFSTDAMEKNIKAIMDSWNIEGT